VDGLKLDIGRCMAGAAGTKGLTPELQAGLAPRLEVARKALLAKAGTGMLGWMGLPLQDPRQYLEFADAAAGRYECLLVIGIGGSALGTTALKTALLPFFWNELSPDERRGRSVASI
jgi:glucose-6-phosphate isomerase